MRRVAYAGTENVSDMVIMKSTAYVQNDGAVIRLSSFCFEREYPLKPDKTGFTPINSILPCY